MSFLFRIGGWKKISTKQAGLISDRIVRGTEKDAGERKFCHLTETGQAWNINHFSHFLPPPPPLFFFPFVTTSPYV